MNLDLQSAAYDLVRRIAPGNSAVSQLLPYISPDDDPSARIPFVGMDLSSGRRGVDLNKWAPSNLNLTSIDAVAEIPEGQKLDRKGKRYIGEDAPVGIPRIWDGFRDAFAGTFGFETDYDKQGLWGGGQSKQGYGALAPTPGQTALKNKTIRDQELVEKTLLNPQWRRDIRQEESDANIAQMRRAMPLINQAAWQGTRRNLYFDEASPTLFSKRQQRAAQSEATREAVTGANLANAYRNAYLGLTQRSPIT